MTEEQRAELEKLARADGWFEWSGGPRPHPPATVVDVRLRDGRSESSIVSAFARWQHIQSGNDIIAFRPAHREAQPETDGGGEVLSNLDRVREFHETFGVPVLASPCIPADRVALRLDILDEERRELSEALKAGDVVEVADALTDMAYLIYGTALEFGIDLNACFAEVHRSNMSKLGADGKPIYREDGKVLKGPNYSPPDLRTILATLVSKGV